GWDWAGSSASTTSTGSTMPSRGEPRGVARLAGGAPRGPVPSRRGAMTTPTTSANLIVHPFGGGVIGNTTGSGPVIEGSSPSPRAPAESFGKPPLGPIV